jgi:hypothetical protein
MYLTEEREAVGGLPAQPYDVKERNRPEQWGATRLADYERDLLFLVSHLDQSLSRLDGHDDPEWPEVRARVCRALLEQLFIFAQMNLGATRQSEAFEKCQAAYAAAQELEGLAKQAGRTGLLGMFRARRSTDVFEPASKAAATALYEALAAYFALLADVFSDDERVQRWVATFRTFLDDVKHRW